MPKPVPGSLVLTKRQVELLLARLGRMQALLDGLEQATYESANPRCARWTLASG